MDLIRKYLAYKNKDDCPFIERVCGNEVSLMTEIVVDDVIKNLFPPSKNKSQERTTSNKSTKNN